MESLVHIVILLLNFAVSDVVMVVAPSIESMRRETLTTSCLVSSVPALVRKILCIAVFYGGSHSMWVETRFFMMELATELPVSSLRSWIGVVAWPNATCDTNG